MECNPPNAEGRPPMLKAQTLIPLPPSQPHSVHTTILFTDIVGSTRHAVELGDIRWRKVFDRHDMLVRNEVAWAGGRLVKSLGDGYLASFDDPSAAVDAAHSLVAIARSLGLEIRAGLHTGEAQAVGDDLVGLSVHIAARVCAMAEADCVLTTAAVAGPAAEAHVTFADRGCEELRGIPGCHHLYEAVPRAATLRLAA